MSRGPSVAVLAFPKNTFRPPFETCRRRIENRPCACEGRPRERHARDRWSEVPARWAVARAVPSFANHECMDRDRRSLFTVACALFTDALPLLVREGQSVRRKETKLMRPRPSLMRPRPSLMRGCPSLVRRDRPAERSVSRLTSRATALQHDGGDGGASARERERRWVSFPLRHPPEDYSRESHAHVEER
jgi:hypothetical protein